MKLFLFIPIQKRLIVTIPYVFYYFPESRDTFQTKLHRIGSIWLDLVRKSNSQQNIDVRFLRLPNPIEHQSFDWVRLDFFVPFVRLDTPGLLVPSLKFWFDFSKNWSVISVLFHQWIWPSEKHGQDANTSTVHFNRTRWAERYPKLTKLTKIAFFRKVSMIDIAQNAIVFCDTHLQFADY